MKLEYESWYWENEHFFAPQNKDEIYQKLNNITDEEFLILNKEKFKNPKVTMLLSVLLDGWDRIYLDDAGVGIFKLATMGCLGVLYIKDIISAHERTYLYNYIKAMEIIDFRDFGVAEIKKNQNKAILNASLQMGKAFAKGAKDISKSFTELD